GAHGRKRSLLLGRSRARRGEGAGRARLPASRELRTRRRPGRVSRPRPLPGWRTRTGSLGVTAPKEEGLQGMTLEHWSLQTAELFPSLLHQADGLDGLRLGGIHVAGLASSLSLTDQLGRVGATALRAGE